MISLFHSYKTSIAGISIPKKFTFPFYYKPHKLAKMAALELQNYLQTQTDFEHNFGLIPNQKGLEIGKMFGVLVCQNSKNEIGFLWAFSGKLAEKNIIPNFVPTVFDMLNENSFFLKAENEINKINTQLETLENNIDYINTQKTLNTTQFEAITDITRFKTEIAINKKIRNQKRENLNIENVINQLNTESQQEKIQLKKMQQFWTFKTEQAKIKLYEFEAKIEQLKALRKQKSNALQNKLFENYSFLNSNKESKSLAEIFNYNPPAGAGECAAPKLLHYAFQHNLTPICMAEFWWGASPKSEVRKHAQFYPSCMAKCEPILMKHMLLGLPLQENPFLKNPALHKKIEIIFEDRSIIIVNKPHEFLSVPGKIITDSVYQRIKNQFPNATGPLIVHRLDMSTSGIMVLAKTEKVYHNLQQQFIKRKVKKCYEALLNGKINQQNGEINLPLRVDLNDRPRQLVCYEHGKKAKTNFEVIEVKNNKTRIHFYPITGRTHQLRVHSAHIFGLNTPILGDDLYGKSAKRLYLHAKKITFLHPDTNLEVTFEAECTF